MSSAIPIRPTSLEDLRAEIQALTGQVARLQPGRPAMYQFPDRIPRAVVQAQKFTSSLPHVVLEVLKRYAADRGGNINVILAEALRYYVPPEQFQAVLGEMFLEQRRLWTEQVVTPEEHRR